MYYNIMKKNHLRQFLKITYISTKYNSAREMTNNCWQHEAHLLRV